MRSHSVPKTRGVHHSFPLRRPPAPRGMPSSYLLLALFLFATGCAVSTQQEVEMGTGYAGQIAQQMPLIKDAEANAYITRLGTSLSRLVDTRNLEWHFTIVDSKEVNAFAVPGGWIYVNRGLIESSFWKKPSRYPRFTRVASPMILAAAAAS